ncbi:DUF6839 family protein [Thermus thermophilus]|uniref:DUF6839 domain-containing protein n=1 Tax=Thermus thermophilus JL-18 TaxID=798128 RepID=H9ZV21_THETH|nr:hypothetical protein [Thermus thermophilus]AFH40181.1 hypothetical protein TtJL18_2353 [Thermus thermophilus JL-18]
MRVRDLPEDAVLVQDSQDRLAVLESLGLAHLMKDYPTLFVEVGEGEYLKVWGVANSSSFSYHPYHPQSLLPCAIL